MILGSSGFVGYNFLVRSKILDDFNITAIYFKNYPKKIFNRNINYLKADLRDPKICDSLFKKFDVVLNFAGVLMSSLKLKNNPNAGINDNFLINSNILNSLKFNPPSKYIWLSSTTGYPDFNKSLIEEQYFTNLVAERYEIVGNLYRSIERLTKSTLTDSCKIITLRPTAIYGEYDDFREDSAHILPKIINQICSNTLPLKIFADKNELRNWLYVGDLVAAIDCLILNYNKNIELNLGSKQSTSMANLYKKIFKVSGSEDKYELHATKDYHGKALARRISCTKSMKLIGNYNSTTLEDGIERTYKWFKLRFKNKI